MIKNIKKDFGEGGKTYYPINWIIELKMMEKCKTTHLKCYVQYIKSYFKFIAICIHILRVFYVHHHLYCSFNVD